MKGAYHVRSDAGGLVAEAKALQGKWCGEFLLNRNSICHSANIDSGARWLSALWSDHIRGRCDSQGSQRAFTISP
jgi:hypothetical protein